MGSEMCIRDRYVTDVVENANVLGESIKSGGLDLVSGGTDTHVLLVDLRAKGVTGKAAEASLGRAGITCNKMAYRSIQNLLLSPVVYVWDHLQQQRAVLVWKNSVKPAN